MNIDSDFCIVQKLFGLHHDPFLDRLRRGFLVEDRKKIGTGLLSPSSEKEKTNQDLSRSGI